MALEDCLHYIGSDPSTPTAEQFQTGVGTVTFQGETSDIPHKPGEERGLCFVKGIAEAHVRYFEGHGLPANRFAVKGPCESCMTVFDGQATRKPT